MIARITGAAIRGIFVALLIAMPSLLLPDTATRSPEVIALLAILAAALTFAEYFSSYPSFVEFREAPPLNRMRFISLALIVILVSLVARHPMDATALTSLVHGLASGLGDTLDFAFSPIQLTGLMMPAHVAPDLITQVMAAAALSYMIALITIFGFALAIRLRDWPLGNGPFNVWTNLPLFDPTTGGDVVERLQRDARINIVGGVLLPFALPAMVKLTSGVVDPGLLAAPQTLVWVVSAWAFVPASMIMRGLAMLRISDLIAQKRRAAYASSEALQTA
ncbi:hypothetical protein K4L02_14840 [Phaeobacter inhibens]|uniref:hypothetical protein n=1 Tax=Phaeobacter inhibens TaxID=221822 RepID=UPI0021A8D8AE|nr:hypothetical protein [Phaeobacter inhibens]UWR64007.1 hypothetical protein K4L02_14840 [Phaeobacter inhibens]UWR99600.1 hypothetical protein K4L03_14485 [Phaeobacter inhibens]UWS03493.1 hypothetical protein K4K94_14460 [Phaeobacter inhibens]